MMDPVSEPIFIAALALVRIFAVTTTAPILGSTAVAFRIRIGVALALATLALPLVQVPASVANGESATVSGWTAMVFSETAIGIALGLGVTIIFSAANMAGAAVGQMTGLQMGNQPGSDSSPTIERFFFVISLAAFALIGGPAMVVSAMLDTFIHIPLGSSVGSAVLLELAADLLQQSFMLTIRAIGPIAIMLMLSNLTMGLISRTYPQLNILSLGFSSNMVVMLLSVFLSLGGIVWLFMDDVKPTLEWVENEIKNNATVEATANAKPKPILPPADRLVRPVAFQEPLTGGSDDR